MKMSFLLKNLQPARRHSVSGPRLGGLVGAIGVPQSAMAQYGHFLFLMALPQVVEVTAVYNGCSMEVPYKLVVNPEPGQIPLLLGIDNLVIGLRGVTDSGGSFGVDVEYVL